MTSSPLSNTLAAALPSLRSASPFPQILRSAAASSSSSLSSLFQINKDDGDSDFNVSDEARAHQAMISQGFGPTVAVVSSRECDELLKGKGCSGLLELLKPFGDQVQGRVNIRDSQALSVPADDFSVKFVDFHYYTQSTANGKTTQTEGRYAPKQTTRPHMPGGDLEAIEQLMEKKMETISQGKEVNGEARHENEYAFFLRRMLSAMPLTAHETFSHPVTCVLAVSSRHHDPIDAFLGLYNTTNNAPIPRFIDAGFLRYYVLVHDEDNDDFDR
jgi:trafficking protein particle complex subunit 8